MCKYYNICHRFHAGDRLFDASHLRRLIGLVALTSPFAFKTRFRVKHIQEL